MTPQRMRTLGFVLAGFGVVLGIVGFGFRTSKPPLPTYNGKTVEEWFYGPDHHCGRSDTVESAKFAFNQMGTNCLPFLLQNLRTRDSNFGRFYARVFAMFPNFLKTKLKTPLEISYIQMVTFHHLGFLRDRLDYIAEELLEILPMIEDATTRKAGLDVVTPLAIRLVDDDKKRAFFSRLFLDSDFSIQLQAAIMMSRIDSSVTNGMPILLNAITNKRLVASTVTPMPAPFPDQRRMKQQEAHEALRQVSPTLARSYQITE